MSALSGIDIALWDLKGMITLVVPYHNMWADSSGSPQAET